MEGEGKRRVGNALVQHDAFLSELGVLELRGDLLSAAGGEGERRARERARGGKEEKRDEKSARVSSGLYQLSLTSERKKEQEARNSPRGSRGSERGNEHGGLASGGARTCSWLVGSSCCLSSILVHTIVVSLAQAGERAETPHHRLLQDVLIHGILGEARAGNDEYFELLEIEMAQYGGVDLLVEARVGLAKRASELAARKEEERETGRRERDAPCLHRERWSRLFVSEG